MQTVYDYVMEAVRCGASLFIDLSKHVLEVREFGRRKPVRLIDGGVVKDDMPLGMDDIVDERGARHCLNALHRRFMHSVPTAEEARDERRVRNIYYSYFRAPDKLSREDTLLGISRTESRAELTMATLICCMRGLLSDSHNGWAIRVGPGLVVKSDWIIHNS